MAADKTPSPEQIRAVYESAVDKGRELYQALNSFAWTDRTPPKLEECYSIDTGPLRRIPIDIIEQLKALGVDLKRLTFVDVLGKGSGEESDAIYSNWFNGNDGVIVCHENDKGRDSDPPSLWPSEAIWQSFVMVADKEQTSPSDLRYVIRHSVKNERTRMVIWQAARENAIFPMLENGYREYLPLDEGFFALLGSVNGSSTMRMLLDHKKHIGHKTVEKIVVLPCTHHAADVNDFRKHRSFMLVLSNERKPMQPRQ